VTAPERADAVRVIEYEVLAWTDLSRMGDVPTLLREAIGEVPHVGILRCVTMDGRRVTFIGDADATAELVRSGAAGNPAGARIPKKAFPVMLEGWPHRLRPE
jgi:hypothetical protein